MSRTLTHRPPDESGPAWEIARLFPDQGRWDESDYLELKTNQLVEFSDGCVEVLPMPTLSHQRIVRFLFQLLAAFVSSRRLGEAFFAPLRVRLREGQIREPDVLFMLSEHADRMHEECWEGADLVMEVVSDSGRDRDLIRKRKEYAEGGVAEYWIVDPQECTVTVLRLEGGRYVVDGQYGTGQQAKSALLHGFAVEVDAVWKAEQGM